MKLSAVGIYKVVTEDFRCWIGGVSTGDRFSGFMTRPSGRRPRRGHTPRRERRVIRVLTEGKITEPSYLTAWARRYRHRVSLSLSESGMAPETLINHASQHIRRRRRSRRGDQDFDEIWCVFDIDNTRTYRLPYTTHARVASKSRFPILASSSGLCCTSKIKPRTSIGATCSVAPTNSNSHPAKGIPDTAWNSLFDEFATARRRAKALDERHAGNGSPPRSNPSTDIWRIVDRIRSARDR